MLSARQSNSIPFELELGEIAKHISKWCVYTCIIVHNNEETSEIEASDCILSCARSIPVRLLLFSTFFSLPFWISNTRREREQNFLFGIEFNSCCNSIFHYKMCRSENVSYKIWRKKASVSLFFSPYWPYYKMSQSYKCFKLMHVFVSRSFFSSSPGNNENPNIQMKQIAIPTHNIWCKSNKLCINCSQANF